MRPGDAALRAAFQAYHKANPEVWRLFVLFTLEVIRMGYTHFSADAIMHRVRWETAMKTKGGQGFKIPNAHVAFYAREFMRSYPQYDRFFRTAESAADRTDTRPPILQDA